MVCNSSSLISDMFFFSLYSMTGGVAVLSTGLIGAYQVASGMVGKRGRRRSFLVLTMIQVKS